MKVRPSVKRICEKCKIIRREGKVLVGQRPEGSSLAKTWEFPGGKMELSEDPEKALARELNEELGIDAEIGALDIRNTGGNVVRLIQRKAV